MVHSQATWLDYYSRAIVTLVLFCHSLSRTVQHNLISILESVIDSEGFTFPRDGQVFPVDLRTLVVAQHWLV